MLLHLPDKPFAYGVGPSTLRVIVRTPRESVEGGRVAFNDRYAWDGNDYAPLRHQAPLRLYALDGELAYWAADLRLQPPRLRYRFGLDTKDGLRWYGSDGLRDEPAPRDAFEFAYLAEGDRPDSPDWARGAVFYHVFPDRFARSSLRHMRAKVDPWGSAPTPHTFLGGDLDGIVEQLDHIAGLGVDAVYLTPIFLSPSNHKYDTADYFTVDPDFGGNPALGRLVSALHARGMRLVLDGVFNHAGSKWPPFVDARTRGQRSPYARWFYLSGDGYETWASNVDALPKLRTSEPALRDLVCRIGRFWVEEFGIDGWRLDVANEVDHALWRAFRSAVRGANPDVFLVGEVWDLALPWLRGDQFDSTMNYPLRRAILDFASGNADGERMLDSIDRMRAAYPEPIHDLLYNLLGSHDEMRPLTAVSGDRRAAALAAALLYTLPGIVSIYYGDEVGMAGGQDPDNRRGMVWDEARQDRPMLDLYRRLGSLRRTQRALRSGRYERLESREGLIAFARGSGRDRIVLLANSSKATTSVATDEIRHWLGGQPLPLAVLGYQAGRSSAGRAQLRVPAQGAVLVGRQPGAARG